MLQLGDFYFSMTHPIGKIEMSPRIRQRLFLMALLVGIGSACRAESESPFAQPKDQPVTATLIAEHASIRPGGATRIGVLFNIEEDWHIYAQDPGDAGLPTKVEWTTPQGVVVGELIWPAHHELLDPGDIRTFGYETSVLLASSLEVGEGYAQPQIPMHANVSWLACKEICIPGKADLDLVLPLNPDPPALSSQAPLFASQSREVSP